MKKKIKRYTIKYFIVVATGLVINSVLKPVNDVFTNKMAMLQFSNSNTDYITFKLMSDICKSISLVTFFVCGYLVCKLTYKFIKDINFKGENKDE